MKSINIIEEEIKNIEEEIKTHQKRYDNLPQITIQGPEGKYLKDQINKMKGKLEGLQWVLNLR